MISSSPAPDVYLALSTLAEDLPPTPSATSLASSASSRQSSTLSFASQPSTRPSSRSASPADLAPTLRPRLPPATFHATMAAGNVAAWSVPPDFPTAAQHWLDARRLPLPPSLFDTWSVAQALAGNQRERGVLQLHLALLAPDAVQARMLFEAAATNWPAVTGAVNALIAAGRRRPDAANFVAQLEQSLVPLYGEAQQAQHEMMAAFRAGDGARAKVHAEALHRGWPHLLAPKAALCLLSIDADTVTRTPRLQVRASAVKAFAIAQITREVRDWDANAHVRAMGALAVADHRYVWASFLERAYALCPIVYGARYLDGETLQEPARAQRHLNGLPWDRACALPLPDTWRTCVAAYERTLGLPLAQPHR